MKTSDRKALKWTAWLIIASNLTHDIPPKATGLWSFMVAVGFFVAVLASIYFTLRLIWWLVKTAEEES